MPQKRKTIPNVWSNFGKNATIKPPKRIKLEENEADSFQFCVEKHEGPRKFSLPVTNFDFKQPFEQNYGFVDPNNNINNNSFYHANKNFTSNYWDCPPKKNKGFSSMDMEHLVDSVLQDKIDETSFASWDSMIQNCQSSFQPQFYSLHNMN